MAPFLQDFRTTFPDHAITRDTDAIAFVERHAEVLRNRTDIVIDRITREAAFALAQVAYWGILKSIF